MRITHTNGTDIRLRVESRVVGVSDGVISAEDIAKGPPHTQVWLPAGEVYVTPVPGSADGKLVFDYSPFEEGALTGATFTFRAGKLVAHTAAPGDSYTRWNAAYADAPSGKDDFAYIDLGINPNVQVPAGTKLTTWVPAGTVSVGLGNNLWAGGTNNGSWSFDISMAGCTVTIDEKVIVERVLHQDTMSDAIRREIIEAPINIARDLVGEVKQTADNAVNSSPSGKSAGTSSARQANDSNDLLSSLLDVATKTAQLADRIGLEATSLTDEQEAAIGREINRNILGDTKEFLDASSQHRVEAIAKQLITQCRRKNIVYTIKLLDSTNVNAFSVAGGYVYVTQAFLKQFPSDAALALTLGHEIAHVDLRHCVEKIQYQVKGKELVGDASNLAQFVYATLRSPYSRSQEFEADAYGFRAAMKSGWRDQQLLQFMRELSAYQRKGAGESQDVETIKRDSMTVLASRLDDYFASHPSTTERVARLEAIAKSE
jgi:Zn-dependent protease with chaperone function